jgi:hypothetical protein
MARAGMLSLLSDNKSEIRTHLGGISRMTHRNNTMKRRLRLRLMATRRAARRH